MESATTRLSRVLELSATLKMILRLQFEARKLGSGLDLESISQGGSYRFEGLDKSGSECSSHGGSVVSSIVISCESSGHN